MSDNTIPLLFTIKFWLLLILFIPSVLCSIMIVVYFYRQKQAISPHYHLTLLLIVVSFLHITTDILFSILFYRYGQVIIPSVVFCTWWSWWEYSLSTALLFIMAWASVQRHFLIFRNGFLGMRRQRILYHFIPFSVCCTYPALFYFSVIVMSQCQNQWDFTKVMLDI